MTPADTAERERQELLTRETEPPGPPAAELSWLRPRSETELIETMVAALRLCTLAEIAALMRDAGLDPETATLEDYARSRLRLARGGA